MDYEDMMDYAAADAAYAEQRYRANYSSHVFDYYGHLEDQGIFDVDQDATPHPQHSN